MGQREYLYRKVIDLGTKNGLGSEPRSVWSSLRACSLDSKFHSSDFRSSTRCGSDLIFLKCCGITVAKHVL